MQILVKTLVALLISISVNSQTITPEPPKTPTTNKSNHSSSVSVSKTDDDYRFKARFHKSRYESVKSLLLKELGSDGLSKNGKSYEWSHGHESFTCKLTKTGLKLYLDYESNGETFIKHIDALGVNLKYAISGGNPEDDRKRAQNDIRRAEEDLARAKEELERAKRELEEKDN